MITDKKHSTHKKVAGSHLLQLSQVAGHLGVRKLPSWNVFIIIILSETTAETMAEPTAETMAETTKISCFILGSHRSSSVASHHLRHRHRQSLVVIGLSLMYLFMKTFYFLCLKLWPKICPKSKLQLKLRPKLQPKLAFSCLMLLNYKFSYKFS